MTVPGPITSSPRPGTARPKLETILVVDDDPQICELVYRILHNAGYMVLRAGGVAELPALLGNHTGNIDLVVSDVVMPKVNGPDVCARISGAGWMPRVLFMSGYPDAASALGLDRLDVAYLAKPFTTAQLLRSVREVLDAPAR